MSEIATFTQAEQFLETRMNVERSRPEKVDPVAFKLDRMRALAAALGNPQHDQRFVHIAGSKGKGSVVEMTASCLMACGYATGAFTSPHLVTVRERLRINGLPIAEDVFAQLMDRVAEASAAIEPDHGPTTYFECVTAAALLWFAEQAIDIAIIETGLGGRLDATNIIYPEVAAITAIQSEHTALLGDTLALIAAEKGGIFKPGADAISVPQPPEVAAALREAAVAADCDLLFLDEHFEFSWRYTHTPEDGQRARVYLASGRNTFEHMPSPFRGEHQAENTGLVLAILDHLTARGIRVSARQIAEGLAATPRNGRLEMIWRAPRIMVDGAHNPESIRALVRSVGAEERYDALVVIFGCSLDKDVDGMLRELTGGADKVIFTRSADNRRAADPADLLRRFESRAKAAQMAPTLRDAINLAHKAAGRDDLICITGSFYLAGEAKRLIEELKARRSR